MAAVGEFRGVGELTHLRWGIWPEDGEGPDAVQEWSLTEWEMENVPLTVHVPVDHPEVFASEWAFFTPVPGRWENAVDDITPYLRDLDRGFWRQPIESLDISIGVDSWSVRMNAAEVPEPGGVFIASALCAFWLVVARLMR